MVKNPLTQNTLLRFFHTPKLSAVQYSSVHYKHHISGGSCSQGVLFKNSGLVCTGDIISSLMYSSLQQFNENQFIAVYLSSVQCSIVQYITNIISQEEVVAKESSSRSAVLSAQVTLLAV